MTESHVCPGEVREPSNSDGEGGRVRNQIMT